jgi:hypothetical protein
VERLQIEHQTAVVVPKKSPGTELVLASDTVKPPLDTMNVFLSCLEKVQKANDALLAQMETQAKIGAETLQNVVAQIFNAQKADRDDERYRFDALRKDKQERLKSRHPHSAPATKRKA